MTNAIQRLHSSLNYLTPAASEAKFAAVHELNYGQKRLSISGVEQRANIYVTHSQRQIEA
jgi:hypothetical protein